MIWGQKVANRSAQSVCQMVRIVIYCRKHTRKEEFNCNLRFVDVSQSASDRLHKKGVVTIHYSKRKYILPTIWVGRIYLRLLYTP